MVSRGFPWVLVMAVLYSPTKASQPLQQVEVESAGMENMVSEAVEWLVQDWQKWATRDTMEDNQLTQSEHQQTKTDGSQDQNEVNQHYENDIQAEGDQQEKGKRTTVEDNREKKATMKRNNRRGRMMEDDNNKDDEEEDTGRLFLGTTGGNQQVTISLQGLAAGILYIVLAIILFKFIAAIITGRDLSYWGRWADNMYNYNRYTPTYYDDDHSTYTTYRHLQDAADKYD